MENYKPFSCIDVLRPNVSENQLCLEVLTKSFYPGMVLYINNSSTPVNRSLNLYVTPVCPGKSGFIALYCSYN